jgi:hypothetical protein
MEKKVVEEIKEEKRKEREDKMAKFAIDSLTPNEKETQQITNNHVRKKFNTT